MTIGELIRYYRKDVLHITQEELGEKLGITKATVQKYEKGKVKNIPRENVESMAEIFGIAPSELMCFENKEESVCTVCQQCHAVDGEEIVQMYLKLNESDRNVMRCMLSFLSRKKEC